MENDPDTGLNMNSAIPSVYSSRIILHIDMDSFYASVEMHRESPEFRGKAVVIGADPKKEKGRGVVATCSYEAREYGIRSAMPISQAFVLCPHAIFLPPDFPLYTRISSEIMTILHSFCYRFEQVSIDEAFLDLSPVGSFSAAELLAGQIKTVIIRTTWGCPVQFGVAPSKRVRRSLRILKSPMV